MFIEVILIILIATILSKTICKDKSNITTLVPFLKKIWNNFLKKLKFDIQSFKKLIIIIRSLN